ncbi:Exonuclease [Bacillus sp. OV322]|uniref:3'-5' exonuclease n=1 Tax=Bacillus sp. OV322 TaxID=1882764 RepID=UPI0008E749E5|nr:3'-5' exonuclease [Bacillus sp. OV322]SFC68159.1 Exonuclease [Bacillus sp. OV322]
MNAIVFDLETIRTHQKGQERHIIEIGAVKIDMEAHASEAIDVFQQYVMPPGNYIPKSSRQMIGMNKEEMKNAISLQKAIKKLKEWIGEEDYHLCSWSRSDLDIIQHNYIVNRFDVSWVKNYNDIQLPISRALSDINHVLGLKKAIELGEIPMEGKWHSGLADSINTANLLVKYRHAVELKKTAIYEVFSIFSSRLYTTCKECKETKYHTEFFKKRTTCLSCEIEKKMQYELQKQEKTTSEEAITTK